MSQFATHHKEVSACNNGYPQNSPPVFLLYIPPGKKSCSFMLALRKHSFKKDSPFFFKNN